MSSVPLTPEELRAWYPFVAVAGKLFAVMDEDMRSRHGLTTLDFHILLALFGSAANRVRMTDLASFSGVDPSTMTYRVGKLETFGFVERNVDDHDGRVINASITPHGRSKLMDAMPDHVAAVRTNFLDHLDISQRTAVADIFSKLMVHFDLPWEGPGNKHHDGPDS